MQIGLTFDEYMDVRLRPSAGADRAFRQAAEMKRHEMFPMATVTASHHRRARGIPFRRAIVHNSGGSLANC